MTPLYSCRQNLQGKALGRSIHIPTFVKGLVLWNRESSYCTVGTTLWLRFVCISTSARPCCKTVAVSASELSTLCLTRNTVSTTAITRNTTSFLLFLNRASLNISHNIFLNLK